MGLLSTLTGFGSKLSGSVSPYLSLASGIGSLFGNKNIDKQIKAQQEENQKNREYNLMLAQMQNDWSQDQWERENEYNTPQNQRKRLEAAGLNADLMYGNGGVQNIAASSPSMTSGAPSSPTDMSALGQKKTIGDMIRDSQATRLAEAQIKQVEAQTRKTSAEAGISETQLEYEDVKQRLGIDLNRQTFDNAKEQFNVLFEQGRKFALENENLSYGNLMKRIDLDLYTDKAKSELSLLQTRLKISEKEAEFLVKTMAARILGVETDTSLKEYEKILNSPKLVEALPEGVKPLVSLLNLIFRGH